MFYSQGCPLLLFPNAKLQFFPKISKRKIKKTSLQLHSNYHTKTDKNILTRAFPKSLRSASYVNPIYLQFPIGLELELNWTWIGVASLYEETFDGCIEEKFEVEICLCVCTLSVCHSCISLESRLLIDNSFRWTSWCSVFKDELVGYLAC